MYIYAIRYSARNIQFEILSRGYYGIGFGIHLLSSRPADLAEPRITDLTYCYGKGYNFRDGNYWKIGTVIQMKLNFPSVEHKGLLQFINEQGEVEKQIENIVIDEYCMAVSISGGGFDDTMQAVKLIAYV